MKRAGEAALDRLDDLLKRLRKQDGLTERKRGVFYRAAAAFLHFHEDAEGLFADVRTDANWERLPFNTRIHRRESLIRSLLTWESDWLPREIKRSQAFVLESCADK